ncbi:phosphate ABC transporter permease PstA [Thermoflexus sp.]|uniref:phosphate ABC transporter permease PstA n=1 Tax=Thermoflexus sp. TaxID=1969742 RepID=UPI0025E2BA79|nr:phosphate ABC transporter permease PstA [Thermoflexus sp.]MDW8064201.1 phosphate ABC transporter permease PstA [Anaerolineae bacterium]MCS6963931.1 phosphate ABC transporter permease PstA [Thermoflexus sp.]MCS7350607.1 phosphate ABC transporter permease PstA [Thermoflexus sp.]MCX7690676.1 phosphate ABC transporter permease PstA [Thermoflexus sp.]MDW8180058.1 phosphate ABC transporter permease PstA [Anaerolineae bacterium]
MELRKRRELIGKVFEGIALTATAIGLVALTLLLLDVARRGLGVLSWSFFVNYPSRFPEQAGIRSALLGTLWVISLTALFSVPLGIAAAIYLEEYAPRNRLTRLIELNINNLAGVPSIIYGLLGLELFVRGMRLERSILAGALTLSLLILPILITASREALRAVPMSLREAAFALGATRWQVVRHQVLPVAFPGILTGIILALSRAIGETAPLITIGALTFIAFDPRGPLDKFTVLPIQIFNWVSRPQEGFHRLAAGAILILLVVLLSMNALAIYLRNRLQRRYQW